VSDPRQLATLWRLLQIRSSVEEGSVADADAQRLAHDAILTRER
jgi:hypothetical protein